MSNQVNSMNKGLTVKDLVTTGIFTALLFVFVLVGGVFFATNPVLTFFMPAGGGLLAGPIYLLLIAKVHKPHGVTSGSPLHFVGEPFAKTVYVTEGLLKADIAHCLTGRSFVAVAGVNSLNGLESALRCMAQNGTKLVVEAYDMDKLENEYVASAAEKVQQIAHAVWLQSTSLVWNTAYKGIDDWQLALRQAEAKEKAA